VPQQQREQNRKERWPERPPQRAPGESEAFSVGEARNVHSQPPRELLKHAPLSDKERTNHMYPHP